MTNPMIRLGVTVPTMETLAAFRQSYRTALREGFERKAKEVAALYLNPLETLVDKGIDGFAIVEFQITPITLVDLR